ncbi:MAG: ExbD/TolR family protein [Acidobacteriota bacterium]
MSSLALTIDETGAIWHGRTLLQGADLINKVAESNGSVFLKVESDVPYILIEETITFLRQAGAKQVSARGAETDTRFSRIRSGHADYASSMKEECSADMMIAKFAGSPYCDCVSTER